MDGLNELTLYMDIESPGELNYIFTKILHSYINKNELRYKTINEAIGVLECCKLELYRRIASPYEDSCIMKNGDVNDVNFENKKG
jgi:hypothetical protein